MRDPNFLECYAVSVGNMLLDVLKDCSTSTGVVSPKTVAAWDINGCGGRTDTTQNHWRCDDIHKQGYL
jgi:hypothetical protein